MANPPPRASTLDDILRIWNSGYSDGQGRRYSLGELARRLSALPLPEGGTPAVRTLIELAKKIMDVDAEPNKQLTYLNQLDAAFRMAHRGRYPGVGGARRTRRMRGRTLKRTRTRRRR